MYKFSKNILSTIIALTLVGSNAMPTIVYAADEMAKEENSTVQSNEISQELSSTDENQEEQKWEQNPQITIKQELKRYLKYENKTLVSFLISSGVKDNTIPLLEKTIQVYVPKIQEKEPSKIIVSGNDYTYQDQILIIKNKYNDKAKQNEIQEGKITEESNSSIQETNNQENTTSQDEIKQELNWNSNDEILVTYIYDVQMEESALNSLAIVSAKTIDERDIEEKTENTEYNVSEQVGDLLETSITGDKKVNKGYLYTNLFKTENKLETKFTTNYQVNIGFTDLIDEIQIKENDTDEILTKKITVNKDEIINILGEDGEIKVLDNQNKELGILKADNLELNIESYGLKFITSKPKSEGYINFKLEKSFNVNTTYTLETIQSKNEIQGSLDVIGNLQGNEVSNNHIENKIELVEPSSNASISVSKNVLSTVVTNENVVITATLEKNDIADALYKNPELLITLPSQITGIKLKDARLIYENELIPVTFQTFDNKIYLKLEGVQTEYSSLPNVDGTVVKIVADLTLDSLTPSTDEKIVLQYTNRVKDEIKSVEVPIKIVAPTGFITSNYGAIDETVSCIGNDGTILIKANDVAKQIKCGGIVVSNLKENANGLMVLGRFPANDTKSVDGNNSELNSTYTINVNTPIEVEGLDADIYYSDNGDATYDLTNEQNGWSTEKKDTSKSYLIVSKSEVAPAQKIEFSYNGTIPQNLDYENKSYTQFGVYYNNGAEEGIEKNVVSSKILSVETENVPVIKTEIIARDYLTKDLIKNGGKIKSSQRYEYVIRATNTGTKAAENVKIIAKRPENTTFLVNTESSNEGVNDSYKDASEELTKSVEKINPGETVEYVCLISTDYTTEELQGTFRAEVVADNMEENSTASFENILVEGSVELELYTDTRTEDVKIGDEINYELSISNHRSSSIKNGKIDIAIPKYIELQNYEDGSYNEESRTLSYNVDEINYAKLFNFTAKVMYSDEPNQEISLTAIGTFDGIEEEIKSNSIIKNVQDTKGFSANLSSNIAYKMLDTDTVEYYLNVKNESKKTAKIGIYDRLPDGLSIKSYIVKNGNSGYTENKPGVAVSIEEDVKPGENLKITIVGKPYILDSVGQIKEIENKVNLTINGMKFELNSVKQQIEGTSNFNTVVESEEEGKEEKGNIYSISGKIWLDENGNSSKDENEVGMAKALLKLYNVDKKEYVKDNEGKEIEIYSDDNGNYVFENLENGRYIVIADYDGEVYEISNYQTSGVAQNENNDFIESKNEENEYNSSLASTNIITINGENVYNIDLGLIDSQNFNIVLNNKISKISVVKDGKTTSYDIAGGEQVNEKQLENSTLIIEYLLEIKNEGNIDGYATEIESSISGGMQFVSELNKDWYINSNGEAINTSLANKLIKSGETATLKLILTKKVTNVNNEILQNSSEIRSTYNKYGIEEVSKTSLQDSKAKSARIIINETQEDRILPTLAISISIIVLISLLGVGVYKSINKFLRK